MSNRVRRPRRSEVRDRLIEAAGRVLVERGFEASVEEITERAGFSRGAFYSNFGSKEELFLAALEVRLRQRIVDLEAWLQSADDPMSVLAVVVSPPRATSAHREFAERQRFLFHALARLDMRPALKRLEERRRTILAQTSERLLSRSGATSEETVAIGQLLSALEYGLAIQTYLAGKPAALDVVAVAKVLTSILANDLQVAR